MPIKITKTVSVSGAALPYTYQFTNTSPMVSFSNQTGSSSASTLTTDIIFPSEAAFALYASSLVVTDANGCRTTQALTTTNPCNTSVTMTVSGYKASAVSSAAGCNGTTFVWSHNPQVLSVVKQTDSAFGSEIEYKPVVGAALPSTTPISVVSTDCNGCQATASSSISFSAPAILLSTTNIQISCPDTDSVYRHILYVTQGADSSQIDWSTLAFFDTLSTSINADITTEEVATATGLITRGKITITSRIALTPQTATFSVFVNDIFGVETRAVGTFTVTACSRVGNIRAGVINPTLTNVDSTAISGDIIVIPVTHAAVASTLVDWNTAQVLASPAYVSSSITFRTTPELEQVIDYEYAGTSDLFAWTVDDTDGNTLPPSTVSINVLPTPPVASDENVEMVIGETETFTPLANDTSSAGLNPASLRIVTPSTSGGTATANADGTLTFVSDVTDTGGTIVQYKVNDIYNQESNTATVSITRISAGTGSENNLCATALASTTINLHDALAGTRIVTPSGTWTNLGTASPSPSAPGTYNGDITFTQGTHAAGTHTYRYTVVSGSASDTADVEVTFITHTVPTNNECSGATSITFSGRGANTSLTDLTLAEACPGNAAATLSVTALPSAWGAYSFTSDVWYTFTATAYYDTISMTYVDYPILVSINGANYGTDEGIYAPAIAIYDGTCGALVERSAALASSSTQSISAQANMSGSTSKTYFVRVSSITGYEGKYAINVQA